MELTTSFVLQPPLSNASSHLPAVGPAAVALSRMTPAVRLDLLQFHPDASDAAYFTQPHLTQAFAPRDGRAVAATAVVGVGADAAANIVSTTTSFHPVYPPAAPHLVGAMTSESPPFDVRSVTPLPLGMDGALVPHLRAPSSSPPSPFHLAPHRRAIGSLLMDPSPLRGPAELEMPLSSPATAHPDEGTVASFMAMDAMLETLGFGNSPSSHGHPHDDTEVFFKDFATKSMANPLLWALTDPHGMGSTEGLSPTWPPDLASPSPFQDTHSHASPETVRFKPHAVSPAMPTLGLERDSGMAESSGPGLTLSRLQHQHQHEPQQHDQHRHQHQQDQQQQKQQQQQQQQQLGHTLDLAQEPASSHLQRAGVWSSPAHPLSHVDSDPLALARPGFDTARLIYSTRNLFGFPMSPGASQNTAHDAALDDFPDQALVELSQAEVALRQEALSLDFLGPMGAFSEALQPMRRPLADGGGGSATRALTVSTHALPSRSNTASANFDFEDAVRSAQRAVRATPLPMPGSAIAITPKTQARKGVRSPHGVPRPRNSWIIYRQHRHQILRAESLFADMHTSELSQVISELWRQEPEAVRQHFRSLAEVEKADHAGLFPDYVYQRRSSKSIRKRGPTMHPIKKKLAVSPSS